MKFSIFVCTLLMSLRGSVSQGDLDVDALIENTFSTGGTTEDCECVPFFQCSENKTTTENGEGVIDIAAQPESCASYLEVCCKKGATIKDSVTPAPLPDIPEPGCGRRNFEGVGSLRISGGVEGESQFGEFPWMVALTRMQELEGSNRSVSVYQCGGSLISPNVVLTAAHCVNNKTGLSVRAGEWDTQTNNEPLPMQVSAVKEVVIHEEFRKETLHNDIALLVLEKSIELAPHIRPICLPAQDENMDGRQCVATGWGKDVFGREGKYQAILKKVEKQTVPSDKCTEAIRTTRLGSRFTLHESFICAGGILGQDTCQGDGGGPLVCPSDTDPQIYVQAGIVAWGVNCGTAIPSVYVNVAKYRNWMDDKMNQYNQDPRMN